MSADDASRKVEVRYDDGAEEVAEFPDEEIYVEGLGEVRPSFRDPSYKEAMYDRFRRGSGGREILEAFKSSAGGGAAARFFKLDPSVRGGRPLGDGDWIEVDEGSALKSE